MTIDHMPDSTALAQATLARLAHQEMLRVVESLPGFGQAGVHREIARTFIELSAKEIAKAIQAGELARMDPPLEEGPPDG